jgi:hypothetical protein
MHFLPEQGCPQIAGSAKLAAQAAYRPACHRYASHVSGLRVALLHTNDRAALAHVCTRSGHLVGLQRAPVPAPSALSSVHTRAPCSFHRGGTARGAWRSRGHGRVFSTTDRPRPWQHLRRPASRAPLVPASLYVCPFFTSYVEQKSRAAVVCIRNLRVLGHTASAPALRHRVCCAT